MFINTHNVCDYRRWMLRLACGGTILLSTLSGHAATLTHQYDFEQSKVTDSVGTAHGKIGGQPTYVPGRVGEKALFLDGDQDYVTFESLDLTDSFTITMWVKPAYDGPYYMQSLLGSTSTANKPVPFYLAINTHATTDGRLCLGTNGMRACSRPGMLQAGVWQALAVTVDLHASPANIAAKDQAKFGTATFYVNGVEVTQDSPILNAMTTQVNLVLGRMEGTGYRYRGAIDDVRIYSGTLTPDEISALAKVPQGADRSSNEPVLQVPSVDKILTTLRKPHPRIMLTAERLQALKANLKQDPTLQAWYAILQKDADAALKIEPTKYDPKFAKGMLEVSRLTLRRVADLALMYHLTGEQRYADRAWRELETVAAYPDWDPTHWLDTAEMTAACAIGYDWLYEAWTPEQRNLLRHALIEKGLQNALDTYENRLKYGWYRVNFNWNQVCNGGVALGALAIAEDDPELAGKLLRYGLLSLPRALVQFAPDGACPEAPNYWCYANLYSTMHIAALHDALGTDFGLTKLDGFATLGDFPMHIMGPTELAFNYGDSPTDAVNGPEIFWLANHYNRPDWARHQRYWVRPEPGGHDLLPLNMLWYDPALAAKPAPSQSFDRYFRNTELVTFRSAWENKNASFLSFKVGDNAANHSHMSAGSFVYDALGARWALQLGADRYSRPGYFDTNKFRWNYYRTRAEGQNTLVINPGEDPGQELHARMIVDRFVPNPQSPFAITNLTPAYAKQAQRVERGFTLLDRQHALIQDEIKTFKPSEVWWFMHTNAQITINPDGASAILKKRGKTLLARVLSPSHAKFFVMNPEPLPTSPKLAQEPNEGVRKLTIHLTDLSEDRIVVLLTPLADETLPPPAPPKIVPLANW